MSRLTWAGIVVVGSSLAVVTLYWAILLAAFYDVDTHVYIMAAVAVATGQSPYLPSSQITSFVITGAYIYPPTLAQLLTLPVAFFGSEPLRLGWNWFCAASPVAALYLGFRAAGGVLLSRQGLRLALMGAILSLLIWGAAEQGNAASPLALAGALTLYWGGEARSGFVAGLATAIKLIPGPVALMVALRGRRGFSGVAMAGLGVLGLILLAPGLWVEGVQVVLTVARLNDLHPTTFQNLSLPAFGLPTPAAYLCVLALLVLGARFVRRPGGWFAAWTFATVAGLLLSPQVWFVYFATLLPAFGFLAVRPGRFPALPWLTAIIFTGGANLVLLVYLPLIWFAVPLLLVAAWGEEEPGPAIDQLGAGTRAEHGQPRPAREMAPVASDQPRPRNIAERRGLGRRRIWPRPGAPVDQPDP